MIYIDGQAFDNLENKHYLIIRMERNLWTGKSKYLIDVGQPQDKKSEITNEKGKAIQFNSEVDVMNYLLFEGWEHKESNFTYNPSTGAQIQKILFTRKA